MEASLPKWEEGEEREVGSSSIFPAPAQASQEERMENACREFSSSQPTVSSPFPRLFSGIKLTNLGERGEAPFPVQVCAK